MAQVINTNVASLNAQRNLNSSQSSLQTSLERLSTGLRINSAKDDAAGLAISERFTAQIRGQNQAIRNANDGISFAQTAESALAEVGNALQRVRELAVQSVNATNSDSDRQAINEEVGALISEVNRIAGSTQFNGQNVLDGALEELAFQVGANENQTISVDGVDARGSQLGARVAEGAALNVADYSALAGDLMLNGVSVDFSGLTADSGASDVVAAINKVSADSGVTASQAAQTKATIASGNLGTTDGTVTLNEVSIDVDATNADSIVSSLNQFSDQTGVAAENDGGNVVLTSSNGDIELTDAGTAILGGDATFEAGIVLEGQVGKDIVTSATGDSVTLGLQSVANGNGTNFTVNNTNVLTQEDATNAIRTADAALQQINGLRADLGATQSRFESTIANLSTSSENLSAARSRIQDADFAAETANLTKAQILQQAGTSVLSQANSIPQGVLSLLQ